MQYSEQSWHNRKKTEVTMNIFVRSNTRTYASGSD